MHGRNELAQAISMTCRTRFDLHRTQCDRSLLVDLRVSFELGSVESGAAGPRFEACTATCRPTVAWHDCGMARTRISTTVDDELLQAVRSRRVGRPDSAVMDEALTVLLRELRRRDTDAAYESAYAAAPLGEPDEWGDLEAFRREAGST